MELSGNLELLKEPLLEDNKPSAVALSVPAAAEWIKTRRRNLRPWGSFVSSRHFKPPPSMSQLTKRCVKNVEYFQSNYLCIFLGLVFYCIITSPLLLIAIAAALGACYILKLRNAEHRFFLFGRELHLAQQYMVVAVCSIPIFIMAGAGSVLFWILGASFFLIALHATFHVHDAVEEEGFDLEMETV